MISSHPLDPLLSTIKDLLRWLKEEKIKGMIIGGVAASIIGRPRMTRDIDAVVIVPENQWPSFLNTGKSHHFIPRRSDALEFAKKSRVLLVHNRISGIDADISLAALPFEEESIARSVKVKIGGLQIPLPSPEDLIIMKAVAGRTRDLVDIESIIEIRPKLNTRRIRNFLRQFSLVLELPEILDGFERLLKKHRKRKRSP